MKRPPLIWGLMAIFIILTLNHLQSLLQIRANLIFAILAEYGWSWLAVLAVLVVLSLSGYAAWQYYQFIPKAVPAGLIAMAANAGYRALNYYVAVRDIEITRQVYTAISLDMIGFDVYQATGFTTFLSPEILRALLLIGLAMSVVGSVFVLASRKYFASASIT